MIETYHPRCLAHVSQLTTEIPRSIIWDIPRKVNAYPVINCPTVNHFLQEAHYQEN
jgi:hypothetical protein